MQGKCQFSAKLLPANSKRVNDRRFHACRKNIPPYILLLKEPTSTSTLFKEYLTIQNKKRTGPQIAFANLGGTVTLDCNENK